MAYQCTLRNIMNIVNIMGINCFTVFSMFTGKSLYEIFFGYAVQSFFKANQLTNGKYPCMKLAHDQSCKTRIISQHICKE